MRILYITTIGGTMHFFKSFIKKLITDGNTVDIASNITASPVPDCYKEWGCTTFQISCSRSPLSFGNIKAVNEIKRLVTQTHYDIIHCHTPIAAACTRLACRNARKTGTKVIYTAHGFHFYKGAPLKNWLLFYPVEKICSYFTDALITINTEDYELSKRKFTAKNIYYVPGVGINVNKFANTKIDRVSKRNEIGVPENAFLLFSAGELNVNKNHQIVLKAMAQLKDKNLHYAIAGSGDQKVALLALAKNLGLEKQFHLLGYRTDVAEIYKAADVYLLPSIREGLNVSVMEAMASGLPCIISDIRGNRDLVDDGNGGYLVKPLDDKGFAEKIAFIKTHNGISIYNRKKVIKFDVNIINNDVINIYKNLMLH